MKIFLILFFNPNNTPKELLKTKPFDRFERANIKPFPFLTTLFLNLFLKYLTNLHK